MTLTCDFPECSATAEGDVAETWDRVALPPGSAHSTGTVHYYCPDHVWRRKTDGALTLDNFTPQDVETLRGIHRMLGDMGDRLDGWWIDKAKINRKSAELFLKWGADVDPRDNRDITPLFEQSPAQLWKIINKLFGEELEEVQS